MIVQFLIVNKANKKIGGIMTEDEDFDKELYKMLDNQVDDELHGLVKYDEILEKLKYPEHDKHRQIILHIQEEQSIHMLEIINIMSEMGMPESKAWQKLEDYLSRTNRESKVG